MSRDATNRFHARPLLGRLPMDSEGAAGRIQPETVRQAAQLIRRGEIYDLDAGRWPGMLKDSSAVPFQVITYRTPSGLRADGAYPAITDTAARVAWIDELVICSMHSGTHVEALSHVTVGDDDHWYGGFNTRNHLGDHGVLEADGASIPPIVGRGVLLDVARYLGTDPLPAGYEITQQDLVGTLSTQGIAINEGDSVLVRTGFIQVWETDDADEFAGSGIGLSAGRWLADHHIVALGLDNENVEVVPSRIPSNPLPLHTEFQVERGIYFVETLFLDELARDEVYEFFFVCAGPRIRGTSGAIARPIAIA